MHPGAAKLLSHSLGVSASPSDLKPDEHLLNAAVWFAKLPRLL
jgi:hypothetical protein